MKKKKNIYLLSNWGSVRKHLSISIGVSLSEVVFVSVPNIVTSSHWAVPATEPVPAIIGAMSIIISMDIGVVANMGIRFVPIYVVGSRILRIHSRSVVTNYVMGDRLNIVGIRVIGSISILNRGIGINSRGIGMGTIGIS